MKVTRRKALRAATADIIEAVVDYLPVWRVCKLRCFECGWEGASIAPYDVDLFDPNTTECGACGGSQCRVVGVVPDLPAEPLHELRRSVAEMRADGWEPEFYPLLHAVPGDN
jgi:hypothetical protein